jgi:hypothetical protein
MTEENREKIQKALKIAMNKCNLLYERLSRLGKAHKRLYEFSILGYRESDEIRMQKEDNVRRLYLNNQRAGLETFTEKDNHPDYGRSSCVTIRALQGETQDYVERVNILEALIRNGFPLAVKMVSFYPFTDGCADDISKELITKILTRQMTEAEYNGYLNGNLPVGQIVRRGSKHRDIYLKPNEEQIKQEITNPIKKLGFLQRVLSYLMGGRK